MKITSSAFDKRLTFWVIAEINITVSRYSRFKNHIQVSEAGLDRRTEDINSSTFQWTRELQVAQMKNHVTFRVWANSWLVAPSQFIFPDLWSLHTQTFEGMKRSRLHHIDQVTELYFTCICLFLDRSLRKKRFLIWMASTCLNKGLN